VVRSDLLSRGEWLEVERQALALGYQVVFLEIPAARRATTAVLSVTGT
jgi:hypothetical protein